MLNKQQKHHAMNKQNMMRVRCSLFTKLFLVKEAQLFKQELNAHVNTVVKQYLSYPLPNASDLGLTRFFITPILKDQESDFPFEPNADLTIQFAEYREWERKRLIEKALHQHVLWQLCNKEVADSHVQIATEILEDLADWKKAA